MLVLLSGIFYLQLYNSYISVLSYLALTTYRAFKSVGGDPVVFEKVKGAYAWDVDGNKYVDYVGSWGPAIAGHANDEVLDFVKETMEKGTSFGAPGPLEVGMM